MDTTGLDESTMPDATIMDGTMDDLFGEDADGLGVSLPSPPLPAFLALRIAEMKGHGCCTKLAWSNTGSIASISPDGSKIFFRAMVRDPKTRLWVLGNDTKNPISAPETRTWVHLQFSSIGVDLAATDSRGVVHIYTLVGPLNKMCAAPSNLTQDDQIGKELDQVVGLYWLPSYPADFRTPYINAANKVGERWEAAQKPRDPNASKVYNPAEQKHAMLHVSQSAKLTLLYQNDSPVWHSVSLDFKQIASSEDLISHAAMGDGAGDGDSGADVLLMTYDFASRLRLYRITINWNETKHARPPNTTFSTVQPSLNVIRLGVIEMRHSKHAGAELTHLRIIPAISVPQSNSMPSFPTVLAVFTKAVPTDASKSFSIISQWHAEPFTRSVHDSFVKLKLGTAVPLNGKPTTELRRQPDVVTEKIILCIESQNHDTLLAFGASDGSLDLRERLTMTSLEPNYADTVTVASLPHAGFEHIPGEHHAHVAMSVDASGLVMMQFDGKLDAQLMSFRYGWHAMDGIGDNKALIEAAVVCLARQLAQLSFHTAALDETLAILPADAEDETKSLLIKTIFRLINRSPDVSLLESQKQQRVVIVDQVIPRILSAQLALGTNGTTGQRNFAAQFAFAIHNMHLIGTALYQTVPRANLANANASELLHSLRGLVRWIINFAIYILNCLIDVSDNLTGTTIKDTFTAKIARSGNPSLHILLCSYSRAKLRFQLGWAGKYFQALQTVISRARSVTERHELGELAEFASKMPFKLNAFDRMIFEIDNLVRQAYTNRNTSADRRTDIEISMMVEGTIPPELETPVNTLMESLLPKVRESADLGRLFFWQTEWLGLASSRPLPNGVRYDVLRKIPIPPGLPRRRCRRCGSEMEDVAFEKLRAMPPWFSAAQKHCVCTNFWLSV